MHFQLHQHLFDLKGFKIAREYLDETPSVGWFKNTVSSQTEKLMAGKIFSDYLGLNHYKKAKKLKHFIQRYIKYIGKVSCRSEMASRI